MIDFCLIKITQFEKTGLIGKVFIALGNLKIKSTLKLEVDHILRDLHNIASRDRITICC